MPQENLATLPARLASESVAGRRDSKPEAGSQKLESGEESASIENAMQEIGHEISQEKGYIKEFGGVLPDDPQAIAETQATVLELDKIGHKYSAQLDSISSSERTSTLRKPAEVIDLETAKTLRTQRASLRMGYKTREQEEAEIDKAFEELMPQEPKRHESVRSERLRKRMEHQAPPTIRLVDQGTGQVTNSDQVWKPEPVSQESASSEQELPVFIPEPSPMAQSVREVVPEVPQIKETLKSPDFEERVPTIREEEPPTMRDGDEEELSTLRKAPEEIPVDTDNEAVLHATIEGLKELSGDEWSDLYRADLPWTEESWSMLSNEAPPGEMSQREELRHLSMDKAALGLSLAAIALEMRKLMDLGMDVPEGHSLFLQKRKLEEALAQDIAKEKKLFQQAHENEDAVDVDVSDFVSEKLKPVPMPIPRYRDEELEALAKIKPTQKPGTTNKIWGGTKYAGYSLLAFGLAGIAKITWSLLSGKAAYKILDWVDKGMSKIQKYAFTNDPISGLSSMVKDTGEAIHKKMDESIADSEKKKEE